MLVSLERGESVGRKNRRKRLGLKPIRMRYMNVTTEKKVKRGQVWFANLGVHPGTSVQGGERPVLIYSNDTANMYADTITVLPMTSHMKKPYLPTHVRLSAAECGTRQDSMVLAEQITTIGKSMLSNCVGEVRSVEILEKITEAVKAQLAI